MNEPELAPPAGKVCTWISGVCSTPAVTHVWREPRSGLFVQDDVCNTHRNAAELMGFQVGYPPRTEAGSSGAGKAPFDPDS